MAGTPDFFHGVLPPENILKTLTSTLINGGTATDGPFGVSGYEAIGIQIGADGGNVDAQIDFEPSTAAWSFGGQTYNISVRSTFDGYFNLPCHGDNLSQAIFTGSGAGTSVTRYIVASNRAARLNVLKDGIILADSTTNVGIGATLDRYFDPWWGECAVFLSLAGGNWAVTIDAENRAGTVQARLYENAAATGIVMFELKLPPRIIHLAMVNNTGAANNARSSVIAGINNP